MKLETKNISLTINEKKIIHNLSLAVNDKELVGLIGPNGSGKSTFLKCLYRVLQPNKGTMFFDGKKLWDMSLKESSRLLGVVAQHNYYNFDFTVESLVLMGRAPYKKFLERDNLSDYEIIHDALTIVGLAGFENRNFSTLSGGEQQRVILARALAQKTACLIMDEPTNHLDIKYQLQIMSIVKKLRCTTLAAIHDLNIAALYCDRIIALKNGEIVGNDTPQNLLTANFIANLFEVKVEILQNQTTGKLTIAYLPT